MGLGLCLYYLLAAIFLSLFSNISGGVCAVVSVAVCPEYKLAVRTLTLSQVVYVRIAV